MKFSMVRLARAEVFDPNEVAVAHGYNSEELQGQSMFSGMQAKSMLCP